MKRILIIKLGAFGDIIQSFGLVAAVRRTYPEAHITVMTRPPFAALYEPCPYINHVVATYGRDAKAFRAVWATDMVIDLQNNKRSNILALFNAIGRRVPWYGTTKFANQRVISHHKSQHVFWADAHVVMAAGTGTPQPDALAWAPGQTARFGLPDKFALVVPGCSANNQHKRWPYYVDVCHWLVEKGVTPVLIGTSAEKEVTDALFAAQPACLDLNGQTTVYEVAALASKASIAIGNDTGPMQMIGPTGCPSLVLFDGNNPPELHHPLGARVQTMQSQGALDALPAAKVIEKLALMMVPL